MQVAAKTYSAARWTAASAAARALLQLSQIALLARLLEPADYGLMAMATVVISYAALFSDIGLSTAYVQRQQISQEERSSLYWISVVVGAALTLTVVMLSPLVASLFNEPRLAPLMALVATNFLVLSFGQQLRVEAEKCMNFRPVALIEIAASLLGFLSAAFGAWQGWGAYALAAAAITAAWATTALSWLILAKGWRPAWRLRLGEVKWFLNFGGGLMFNNFLNQINATSDIVIGGRILGVTQIGLYSVPRSTVLQVMGLINPIFNRVGFPLIASIQNDKAKVDLVYIKVMNMAASINAPIYVAVAVFAPEIVSILLGPNWADATPLLRVLALWGLMRSFANPVGVLLFGLGHVRRATKWNASLALILPLGAWFGSHWGALGMAWANAGLMAGLMLPAWAFLVRPICSVKLIEYIKSFAAPTFCAALAGLIGMLASFLVNRDEFQLILGIFVLGFTYGAFCVVFNNSFVAAARAALCNRDQLK